ncbi:MAG: carboxylesterase family protein [Pseudomonadales bacterium]|nr:carboxylesterase family protein [Pseudomonadales bacterium]
MSYKSRNQMISARAIAGSLLIYLAGIGYAADTPNLMIGEAQYLGSENYDGTVDTFLGVPFAAPPIGDLRWRAAQPYVAAAGQYKADSFAPACYQGDHITRWYQDVIAGFGSDPNSIIAPDVSEDCLYLNVWRPSKISKPSPLPIIVYIHGGSNRGGWSWEPNYLGENLARQQAVVITVAYRLGPFGFMAHPQLEESNFGLTDLVMALNWIKQYSGQLGGDSENITLMGESSGASNISHLIAMPSAAGLFNRVIHQSAGWALQESVSHDDALTLGSALEEATGSASIEAMRKLSPLAIDTAAQKVYSEAGFDPHLDLRLLSSTPLEAVLNNRANPVDLLIGNNADEWKMYLEPDESLTEWLAQNVEVSRISEVIDALEGLDEISKLDRLITSVNYTCPSLRLAGEITKTGTRTWVYYFSRRRIGEKAEEMGAYHGAELPYVFGTHDEWLPTNSDDQSLTKSMMSYWVNFARYGDPNGKDLVAWPAFSSESDLNTLRLDTKIEVIVHPSASLCKALFD